jgi:hypothetical protein
MKNDQFIDDTRKFVEPVETELNIIRCQCGLLMMFRSRGPERHEWECLDPMCRRLYVFEYVGRRPAPRELALVQGGGES